RHLRRTRSLRRRNAINTISPLQGRPDRIRLPLVHDRNAATVRPLAHRLPIHPPPPPPHPHRLRPPPLRGRPCPGRDKTLGDRKSRHRLRRRPHAHADPLRP